MSSGVASLSASVATITTSFTPMPTSSIPPNYIYLHAYEGVQLKMSNGTVLGEPGYGDGFAKISLKDEPHTWKWGTNWTVLNAIDDPVECYLSGVLDPNKWSTHFSFIPGPNYLYPCGELNGVTVTCGPTQAECKPE